MDMVTSTLGDYASFAFSLEVKIGSTDSTISLCANQKKKTGCHNPGDNEKNNNQHHVAYEIKKLFSCLMIKTRLCS
jgi:hypothetical protein